MPLTKLDPTAALVVIDLQKGRSSRELETQYSGELSFIIKNSRAVLYPVYKGTFERGNDSLAALAEEWGESHQSAELMIQQIQDFRRCVLK